MKGKSRLTVVGRRRVGGMQMTRLIKCRARVDLNIVAYSLFSSSRRYREGGTSGDVDALSEVGGSG